MEQPIKHNIMQYIIVTTQWCADRGISIPAHARKSLDGSQVIFHRDFIAPVIGEDEEVKSYEHDSPELAEILNGPEWMEETTE